MADKKKPNAYTKRGLVQARLNNDDYREVLNKAQVYTKGNVSEFVRQAVVGWRPLKRVGK